MTALVTRPTRDQVVVVADLDGTLTFDAEPPGPAVTALLHDFDRRPDVRLVLATSRAPRGVRRLIGPLTDRVDLLCCNGALRIHRDGRLARTPLPVDLVDQLVRELRAAGDAFCLDYGERFRASAPDALPWMGRAGRFPLGAFPPLDGVVKLSIDLGDRWLARLQHVAAGRAELFPHHTSGDLDVTAAGVTKATALNQLLGPDRPRVIAIGNDVNDHDLLTRADLAIVVGHGLPDLDHAGHIHRVPANDTAVAAALRHTVTRDLTARTF